MAGFLLILKHIFFSLRLRALLYKMAEKQPMQSIKLILNISRIFGVLILAEYQSQNEEEQTKIGIIISLIWLGIYTVLFIFAFPDKDNVKHINSVVNRFISFILLVNLFTIIINAIINRRKIMIIINRLVAFDLDTTTKLNYNFSYKKIQKFFVFVFYSAIIFLSQWFLLEFIILVKLFETVTISRLIFVNLNIYVTTFYLIFVATIGYLLYERFKIINEILNNLCMSSFTNENKNESTPVTVLRKIEKLNENLRNLADEACYCFSLPVLTSFGTAFFIVTVHIYHLIILIRDNSTNVDYVYKVGYCLINSICIHVFQIVFVTCIYQFAENEV